MKTVRNGFRILALAMLVAGFLPLAAAAQSRVNRDEYPFSIMTPEPGERRAAPPRRERGEEARPARKSAKQPVRRRGSSTVSTIPTHRSPLTPLGRAPRIGTVQPLGQPGSPATVVPGIRSNTGVAVTPRRPPGQSAQDRAVSCVHAGSAAGVAPGQIGAFTQNCVNR